MNNQEVAKSLKNIRDLYPWGEDSYKTLDYAIRAVVELPKRRKEAKRWRAKAHQMQCEDAISRQAVFEQINCWIGSGEYRYTNATHYLTERIKSLPPVNPQEPCGDWTSRVKHAIYKVCLYEENKDIFVKLLDEINKLPYVNPQEPLTEEDYKELRNRFGAYVEFIVRDMISGKGERWE